MTYSCCSGNFSSLSQGGRLQYPHIFCGSVYPRNLVHSTHIYSPITGHVGSSHNSSCQEIFLQPNRCQTSHVVSSPCQRPCYRPSVSKFCSPCQIAHTDSESFGSSSCHSLGYGSRSSCSLGYGSRNYYSSVCGFSGVRPMSCGIRECPSIGYGSGYFRPN